MSREAMLPCLVCGRTLENVSGDSQNQPYSGTEFRTYGHYGSTFWDSMDGEELVLNVCDDCLAERKDRLGQHKRYIPIKYEGALGYGRKWVDRPMVPYTGSHDDTSYETDVEELGKDLPNVEWSKSMPVLRAEAIIEVAQEGFRSDDPEEQFATAQLLRRLMRGK